MAKKNVFNKVTGKHQKRAPKSDFTMRTALMHMLDGSPSRQDMIDARIAEAVDGMKAAQDGLAGIKRRKN